MEVNQNLGTVTDLHFTGNYADAGNCTVNLVNMPRPSITGIRVDDNRFGRDTSIANCAIFAKYAVTLTDVNDVWDHTGLPSRFAAPTDRPSRWPVRLLAT